MLSPEQILAALRRDSRNHITAFHRFIDDSSKVKRGSGMAGVTLNFHDAYYAGWAPALEMQSEFINLSSVIQIEQYLDAEEWEEKTLHCGGTIYRLKDEYRAKDGAGDNYANQSV
jgi:hypothetical protein